MTVSTHVLDASAGQPAAGVAVSLSFAALPGGWVPAASGETDADGRHRFEAAITAAFASLDWEDVLEAIAGHPRIGDRANGQSAAEQSGVADSSRAALADGNREYEERFGHVYLICAAGLSGEEMLAALRERLGNDPDTERKVATTELRKITVLRARKALGS